MQRCEWSIGEHVDNSAPVENLLHQSRHNIELITSKHGFREFYSKDFLTIESFGNMKTQTMVIHMQYLASSLSTKEILPWCQSQVIMDGSNAQEEV